MGEASIIGVDLAKNVFQLHGAAADGPVVIRKRLPRAFHGGASAVSRGDGACAGPRHWAREIARRGHQDRLIAPRYVKPFIKRRKNDAADAEAIVEAALRPTMCFVERKSADQQAAGRRI